MKRGVKRRKETHFQAVYPHVFEVDAVSVHVVSIGRHDDDERAPPPDFSLSVFRRDEGERTHETHNATKLRSAFRKREEHDRNRRSKTKVASFSSSPHRNSSTRAGFHPGNNPFEISSLVWATCSIPLIPLNPQPLSDISFLVQHFFSASSCVS